MLVAQTSLFRLMGVGPLGILLFRRQTWIFLSLSGKSESAPLLCTARYLYTAIPMLSY